MEKLRSIAYAGWIAVPALLFASGCSGDLPPVPEEAKDVTIEELKEEATTSIDLGTEVEAPSDETSSDESATDASDADEATTE